MTINAKLGESASVHGTHQSGQLPKWIATMGAVAIHAASPAVMGSMARRAKVFVIEQPRSAPLTHFVARGARYCNPNIALKLS